MFNTIAMSQELQDYIAQARKKGFSDKDIYDQLVEVGWAKVQISNALGLSIPKTQQVTTQKDSAFFIKYKQSRILQLSFLIFLLCVLFITLSPFVMILLFSTGSEDILNYLPSLLTLLLFGINFFLLAGMEMNPIGYLLLIPYAIIAWLTAKSIYDESQGYSPIPMKLVKNEGIRAIGLFIAGIMILAMIALAIITFIAIQDLQL